MPDCERLKHAARTAGVPTFDGTTGVGSQSRTCAACACAWLDLTETISLVSPVPGAPELAGCVQKGQGCIPFSFESHGRGHGSCSVCLLR